MFHFLIEILFWLHVDFERVCACDTPIQLIWEDDLGVAHHNYTILPVELHMKFTSFYFESRRPPLKEAYIIHKVPDMILDGINRECLGLVLAAELLVLEAEILVSTHSPLLDARFARVWHTYNLLEPEKMKEIAFLWGIPDAVARVNAALSGWEIRKASKAFTKLSIVICHCNESLEFLLRQLPSIPDNSSLFIYDKCNVSTPIAIDQRFANTHVFNQPDGPVRGDECTGYLDHIVRNYDDLADFIVFLQGDADHHMFLSFLDTALKGIIAGQYDTPFLHLNFHRHYQTTTPCMREVERVLFDLPDPVPPVPLVGTYCCAQFIVRKDRILARQKEFYQKALSMVDGSVPDLCSPTPPRRSSHCYVLEYLWHVVFGEPRFLPHKPDDDRLPILLRMKYGNENVKKRWDDVELSRAFPRILNRTVDIDTC
jgi:hypothetical protein